jgi:microcystin-dependent protein
MSRARELSTVASRSADIKAGTTAFFAMSTAPTGWLACDGGLYSRSVYADLFAAIGTTYGAGDGSTTFNVPDLRGEFVRGLDAGRGVDAGRGLGTAQEDAMQDHVHSLSVGARANAENFAAVGFGNNATAFTNSGSFTRTSLAGGNSVRTTAETRPRNVALLACIKT